MKVLLLSSVTRKLTSLTDQQTAKVLAALGTLEMTDSLSSLQASPYIRRVAVSARDELAFAYREYSTPLYSLRTGVLRVIFTIAADGDSLIVLDISSTNHNYAVDEARGARKKRLSDPRLEAGDTEVIARFFCPDPGCEYHTVEVLDGGEETNPGFNCPRCDKQLQQRVQINISSALPMASDSAD